MTESHPLEGGEAPEFHKVCPECKGASNHHKESMWDSCGDCDGDGWVPADCDWCADNDDPCPQCKPDVWAEMLVVWREHKGVPA